jgi:hypothetical protein
MRQFLGLARELWIEIFGKSWASDLSGWEICHMYIPMEVATHAA